MTTSGIDVDETPPARAIGVDIGGTKTRIVIAPAETAGDAAEPVRDVVVTSASWRRGLGDFAADGLGLRDLLVGRFGEEILGASLAVGAHGCDSTGQCLELERELRRHFAGPVLVVNDSELMAPAMGVSDAIGVVVGTGSIATARTVTGELVTAGGWGWLLGDEGSAPALVRDATRAVLAQLDRGGSLDPLGTGLMAAFSARDGAELALAVTEAASAGAWGVHAPAVFAAADEGSALADDVIRDAGERLAGLVDRLVGRGIRTDAVVAGGSVIERQAGLQHAFRAALTRDHPRIDLHILTRPPVAGAVAMARALARPATDPLRTESSST